MTVIVMESAPEGIRGELTRWFLELKPGVFVGKVNVRIRELLWKRICKTEKAAGAVMVWSSPNEQGFEMSVYGDPKRRVSDFEGVQLITVVNDEKAKPKEQGLPAFPFDIQFAEDTLGE